MSKRMKESILGIGYLIALLTVLILIGKYNTRWDIYCETPGTNGAVEIRKFSKAGSMFTETNAPETPSIFKTYAIETQSGQNVSVIGSTCNSYLVFK